MRILSTDEIRNADRYTLEHEPIASIDLMERAAKTVFDRIREDFDFVEHFTLLCGMGNNGGDGLVIARLMAEKNIDVAVFIVKHKESPTEDFNTNLKRLQEIDIVPTWIDQVDTVNEVPANSWIIDCILGTGLTSPLHGLIRDLVEHINGSGRNVISVDVPTGLFGEHNAKNDPQGVIRAHTTYCFHTPRLSFFDSQWGSFAGNWEVVDIGLMNSDRPAELPFHVLVSDEIATLIKPRLKFSHKGDYGHVLTIAGSKGLLGAGHLASYSALKTGAGKVTWHVPEDCWSTAQLFAPEVMISIDKENGQSSRFPLHGEYNAVIFGPGIGVSDRTEGLLKQVLNNAHVPIVFDADALTLLANNPTLIAFLPPECILTPHPGEMDRLLGKRYRGWDQVEAARAFAVQKNIYLVLKGAHTAICTPSGEVFFNTTGNPGMATAGSGDVLSGIIAGLLAMGYSSFHSACIGVFHHGLAGDFALFEKGEESLTAGDIRDKLHLAFGFLKNT